MQDNSKKKIYVYNNGNALKYSNSNAEALPNRRQEPKRQPQRKQEPPKKKSTSPQTRRNRDKAASLNGKMTLFLVGAVCVTLSVCVKYINLMSDMKANQSQITKLQQELDELKTDNNVTSSRLSSSIDLEEVYKRATQELGMVYAVDGQIVTYTAPPSEYVEQYSNVPQADNNSLLDEIIEIMK